MDPNGKTKRFHYAWVIFAMGVLSVFTSLGFCSSPKSLYLAAITDDLGIPRSLFSISNSIRYITTAVLNLFFGRLVAKFGPRKLIAAGFICLAAYNMIAAISSGVWGFYLAHVLLGLGLAWSTTSLVGIVVEKWFTSRKGAIMGFILASNGLGGAVASQILTRIIYAKADGWRTAFLVTAVIMVAVGIVIVLLMRNDPKDVNMVALGDGSPTAKKQRGSEWVGIDSRELRRKPYFYICLLCVFLTGLILQSFVGIASAHMIDQGINEQAIANAMSLGSLALMFSKTSTGVCFDRFGLRSTIIFCDICAIIAIFMLSGVNSEASAMIYKVIAAFGLPLETIMLPLIVKECFGQKSYASLVGLFVSFNVLGYAIGSPLMNLIFDITGTYSKGLLVMACLMATVTVTMQFVITAAHKERKRVEDARSQ